MKIGIDLSPAVYRRGGIGRYAQELTWALQRVAPDHTYTGFYNRFADATELPLPLDQLRYTTVPWRDKPWRLRVLLSQYLRWPQDRLIPSLDIFHGTDHLLPYLANTPAVFSLHDLTYLLTDTHATLNSLYLRLAMPRFLARAERVIVPSRATQRDALRVYAVQESRICVVPDGVNDRFFNRDPQTVAEVRRKYRLPETFILTVGTIEPRKNLSRLLEAVERLHSQRISTPLVVAGGGGWRAETTQRKLRQLQKEGIVQYLGFVPDSDLPALYQAASLFVYPSLYEGFGLPVLEAMASGLPVVTSSTSSLPEVAGDAASLIDPTNVLEITDAMHHILTNERMALRMKEHGLQNARGFSWDRTALKTLEVYGRVLGTE